MRGKLFKHMFLVAMSVFVACTALFMWSLYSYFSEERQAEQKAETAYVAAAAEAGLNLDALTWGTYFTGNMIPVTLGNILGGLFVGFTMWFGFLRKAK